MHSCILCFLRQKTRKEKKPNGGGNVLTQKTKRDFPGGPMVENPSTNAGTRVRALIAEDPTLRATLSLCTTATEAHLLQHPCSATREATAGRSLHTATRESPCVAMKSQCNQKLIN